MSKNIVRVNKNTNYTIMSNFHLRDKKLSWKAKGIHSYILSLPDDWKVVIEHLKTISKDGRDSTRSGIQELYDLRYWQKYPVYEDGIIREWVTEIYEEPFPEEDKIKNIIIRDGIETINYINKSVDNFIEKEVDLLTGNPQVVENTNSDLLTENQQVGSLEVGNPELLSTNNTNNTNNTNHSFIPKENDNKKDNRMNERMNDNKNQEESIDRKTYFEKIINSLELYGFQKEEDRDALKCAVRYLCYAKGDLETNNMVIPRKEALDHLLEANWFNAEWTIKQFKQMGRIQPITNPIPYIAKILYNSLYDLKLREQSEWRLERLPYID